MVSRLVTLASLLLVAAAMFAAPGAKADTATVSYEAVAVSGNGCAVSGDTLDQAGPSCVDQLKSLLQNGYPCGDTSGSWAQQNASYVTAHVNCWTDVTHVSTYAMADGDFSLSCSDGGTLTMDYPGWCIVNGEPPVVTPPDDCAAKAASGSRFSYFTDGATYSSAWDQSASGGSAQGVYEGCAVVIKSFGMCASGVDMDPNVAGDQGCVVWGEYTGQPSAAGTVDNTSAESGTGQCVTSSAGDDLCLTKDPPPVDPKPGQQCGTVNGQSVCVSQLPDDTCVGTSSGGILCIASGGAPLPKDSSGATIPPDGTITGDKQGGSSGAGTGTTYNYYNSGTVAGSSNYGNGKATTTTDYTCDVATDTCTNTTTTETKDRPDGAFPVGDTVAQSLSSFQETLAGAPIVAGAAGVGASFDRVAACPDTSFTIFGKDFNFDVICQLYDNVSPVLSVVFLAVWSIAGIRIVLSA